MRINMIISLKQLWNYFSVLFLFRFRCSRVWNSVLLPHKTTTVYNNYIQVHGRQHKRFKGSMDPL